MNNSVCISGFLLIGAIFFGLMTLLITPTLLGLLIALLRGHVKWPGPPGPSQSSLFPAFLIDITGPVGAFLFFLLTFLSTTPIFNGDIKINWTKGAIVLIFVLFGGLLGTGRTMRSVVQVSRLLNSLVTGG